jgi:HNH endonuclease
MKISRGSTITAGYKIVTADELRKLLSYNPDTGKFFWLVSLSWRRQAGDIAGSNISRYRAICLNYVRYYEHVLAWLYMTGDWPASEIDHKDRNGRNNRWSNLRLATHAENGANTKGRGISGLKGAYWDVSRNKWRSQITYQGKTINLGRFASAEEAHAAYMVKAKALFREFASA